MPRARSAGRLIHTILCAYPSLADSRQALLKSSEPTIRATALINCAPWVILCRGGSGEDRRHTDYTGYYKQHSHLNRSAFSMDSGFAASSMNAARMAVDNSVGKTRRSRSRYPYIVGMS
jgi:hypothetical protein